MRPAEIQWRLLRAEARALSGPKFNSPAINLARTLRQMRKLLLAERAPKTDGSPRIYSYAIEHSEKRIKKLLPLVTTAELSKALSDLGSSHFKNTQYNVLKACWAIFERTHSEPESGIAVHDEIKAMLRGREQCVPKLGSVYDVLDRLDLPTKRGKRGPARGARHQKTSKKRP